MARSSSGLVLLLVVVAALWQQAHAHAGGLHDWDWTSPEKSNITRVQLATVSNFTFYNASKASSFLPGSIPFFPSYALPATIKGSFSIWEYLDSSCAETAGLQVNNVTITAGNGQPVAHEKVYVWVMTGKCATGVQGVYFHNLTAADNRLNMLWAARENTVTDENGLLWGTAPNIFFPRRTATAAGPAATSVLVAFAPDVSPFLCADIKWLDFNAAAWADKVKSCKPSGPPDRKRLHRRELFTAQ